MNKPTGMEPLRRTFGSSPGSEVAGSTHLLRVPHRGELGLSEPLQTRIDPPGGGRFGVVSTDSTHALPPIEAVRSSALTPTNGESDKPQDKKDSCRNPQEMHCKSGPK
jgi:hypothetical protein